MHPWAYGGVEEIARVTICVLRAPHASEQWQPLHHIHQIVLIGRRLIIQTKRDARHILERLQLDIASQRPSRRPIRRAQPSLRKASSFGASGQPTHAFIRLPRNDKSPAGLYQSYPPHITPKML